MNHSKLVFRSTSVGPAIRGSGNRTQETRQLGAFDRLEVHGPFAVELLPGETGAARLEGDDNLLPLVKMDADGGLLTVRLQGEDGDGLSVTAEQPIALRLPVRNLSRIQAHSMADVRAAATLRGSSLELECHGSAKVDLPVEAQELVEEVKGNAAVNLSGRVARHVVQASGSSEVHALDLAADVCEVRASGSADVEVAASQKLQARASGKARIAYRGDATVSQSLSGNGRIERA